MKPSKKLLLSSLILLLAFVLWTLSVLVIDVQPIGPDGSRVGFATVNGAFHAATGTHLWLYTVTDWLGLVPFFLIFFFAAIGLVQLIRRKSLFKVDADILILGGFYVLVLAGYLLFEIYPVNHRPILINGYLEASYPSSTTLLTLSVMPTALLQLRSRIDHSAVKRLLTWILLAFSAFMVVGRLISGVHWITDIIGGMLLSSCLVCLYAALAHPKKLKNPPKS